MTKKVLSLILAVLMLLPMALACNETTPEETTEAEVPAETTLEETTAPAPTGLSLISAGATEYVIVRPSECQSFIVDAMSELRAAIKDKYGVNISPKDDWVKEVKDGEVYDSVLYISNIADDSVKLTLPSGFVYKTYKGTKPLVIPAKSQCMLSITRVADKTFLVSREELEDVQ